nr:putative integron gene cassette protein [uncultured bacterium]
MALLRSIPVEELDIFGNSCCFNDTCCRTVSGWLDRMGTQICPRCKSITFCTNEHAFLLQTCITASMSTSNFFKSTIASLIFVNAIIHIVPTVVFKHYSPGLWSAVFLYIPISSYSYYSAGKNWELSASITILTILSGMLLMLIPITAQRIRIRLTEQEGLKRERHDVE